MEEEQKNNEKIQVHKYLLLLGLILGVVTILMILVVVLSHTATNQITKSTSDSYSTPTTKSSSSSDDPTFNPVNGLAKALGQEKESTDPLDYLRKTLKEGSGEKTPNNSYTTPPEDYDNIVTVKYSNSILSVRWKLHCFYEKPLLSFDEPGSPGYRARELGNSLNRVIFLLAEYIIKKIIPIKKVNFEIYDQDIYTDKWGDTKTSRAYTLLKASYSYGKLYKILLQQANGKDVQLATVADSWYWNLNK